jgi:transposase
MTLGYSRKHFAKGTEDEKLPAFLTCHKAAFDHFGGVPQQFCCIKFSQKIESPKKKKAPTP